MISGTHIRLTKVEIGNPATLYPVAYWLQGFLVADIRVGEPIHALRYLRAPRDGETEPQHLDGEFTSSPVTAIAGELVVTQNSQWRVEALEAI